jgi:RES domain-containing protein
VILWRLSGVTYARAFDGGYGLHNSGRWNSSGNPITYCATSPSLCALEKLVHVEDPALLPELILIAYHVPDDIASQAVPLTDLPSNWQRQDFLTQQRGDAWLASGTTALMFVPSAVLAVKDSPDLNVLVNHAHPDAGRITIRRMEGFVFDSRLF